MLGPRRLLISVAAIACLAAAAPASAAPLKNCGAATYKVNGVVYTKTDALWQRRTSCKTARAVFRAYVRGTEGAETRPRRFHGYRCTGGSDGVSCHRGKRLVTWGWYYD